MWPQLYISDSQVRNLTIWKTESEHQKGRVPNMQALETAETKGRMEQAGTK